MNSKEKNKKTLEWYYRNRERQLLKMKEWKINNKNKIKKYNEINRIKKREQNRLWKLNNPEKVKQQKKKDDKNYYLKTREKQLIYKRKHHQIYSIKPEVKARRKITSKIWSQKPEVKARRNELARIWRKNNPRSNGIKDLDLRYAMNNVRLRDKNTCQWQGCGLTFRNSSIHVHHIFPRSEYPELELIEQYMICYCANHHGMFHRYRGDPYSEMISWREENDQFAMENYH